MSLKTFLAYALTAFVVTLMIGAALSEESKPSDIPPQTEAKVTLSAQCISVFRALASADPVASTDVSKCKAELNKEVDASVQAWMVAHAKPGEAKQ